MLFDKIAADKRVINEYNKYSELYADVDLATHDLSHAFNVARYCGKISKLLGLPDEQIDEIKVAAILHDVGMNGGKDGHAQRSYEWAKRYLQDFDLPDESKHQILDAIKHHSSGNNHAYGRILAFADKVDVNNQRILPAGLLLKDQRQYANIKDVDFEIKDNTLVIKFTSNGKIDFDELNKYYFTHKIFKSIENLAKHFNLEQKIYMDSKIWYCN